MTLPNLQDKSRGELSLFYAPEDSSRFNVACTRIAIVMLGGIVAIALVGRMF